MAQTKTGSGARIIIQIGDGGKDIGPWCYTFKWKSMLNGGYVIYANFKDPHFAQFQATVDEKYMSEARKKPLKVKFQLKYGIADGVEPPETEERIAYMTDLRAKTTDGGQAEGYFEFIAIDPPSWYLNKGDGEGVIYKGKVSEVIKEVISKYAPGITPDISETTDNKENRHQQMRQDPKSFITSLLDFSSSLTNQKTNWVVASVDEKIVIKEQAELQSTDFGEYSINTDYPAGEDILNWEVLESNYLTNLQTQLVTAGISAVSGLYCDKKNQITKEKVLVNDEKTGNKKNVDIKSDQGFSKPTDKERGITFIRAVPESNSGDLGIKYQEYIDGRARGMFLNMLNILFRMRVQVYGVPKMSDSSQLGVSTIKLSWKDAQGQPFSFGGKWLVYGYEHIFTSQKEWFTNIFISRLDHDATAQKV